MTPGRVLRGILLCFSAVHPATAANLDPWEIRSTPHTNELNGIAYRQGVFVAAGAGGAVLTSSNATEWVARSVGSTGTLFCANSLLYDRFIVGGEGLIHYSFDGLVWTNSPVIQDAEEIHAVIVGYDVAVARKPSAGTSYILYSTNRVHWTSFSAPTTNALFALAVVTSPYEPGLGWISTFVAVGERGTIITSTNRIDWAVRESGTTESLRAAVRHQGRFFAAGDSGVVLTSVDAISWSQVTRLAFDVRGLASSGNALVAVGESSGSGRLQTSGDGVNWPDNAVELSHPLNAVTHGPSSFMAVGDRGLIVQSGYAPDSSINAWTKPTSGAWEERFWSCDRLPAPDQWAVMFTNAESKTLEITAKTTANFSNALTINGLTIYGQADSLNQLQLNNAGTNVALDVRYFVLGTNALLASSFSALTAHEANLDSPTLFAESSRVKMGRVHLASPLTLSNSYASMTLLLARPNVTVHQFGGSSDLYRLAINGRSTFTLDAGDLSIHELYLQSPLPNWEGVSTNGVATFIQNGGDTAADVMKFGKWGLSSHSFRSEYVLLNGTVRVSSMEFFSGSFIQTGGTNTTATISIPNHRDCAGGQYYLSDGVLVSGGLGLGSYGLGWPVTYGSGRFVQSGGVHISSGISLTGLLENAGRSPDQHAIPLGQYFLSGGLLKSVGTHVGGQFTQTGGTNQTEYLSVTGGGEYLLSAGELTTSRADISGVRLAAYHCWGSGGITLEGGAHSIENNLTIRNDGAYRLNAGTLIASNISIGLRARLIASDGMLSNRGIITLRGGTLSAVGAHHPGKLELQNPTEDTPWPCFPPTNSLILATSKRTDLRFSDSSDVPWSEGRLWITGWGADSQRLFFGTNAQGLTEAQLSQLFFVNPVAWRPGQYPARMLNTGEIVPAVAPPLAVARTASDNLVLSWPGEYDLFRATNIAGPFLKVDNATSPATNLLGAPQQYFQLRSREQ